MTDMERLYSNLLIAQKNLGQDHINHEMAYAAREAVDNCLQVVRLAMNKTAQQKCAEADQILQTGQMT